MRQRAWGLAATVATAAAIVLRRRANRWGATAAETDQPLPGDGLVPSPQLGYTRAIDIEAEPDVVWSWLVQIGHNRGGLYSYDWAENVIGCDLHSIEEVRPELQQLAIGDVVRLGPDGYPCFVVTEVERPKTLVLIGADPRTSKPPTGDAPMATWQWQLNSTDRGGTRLLVRQRLSYPARFAPLWRLVEPITFVMEHKMLKGIKVRAERPPE